MPIPRLVLIDGLPGSGKSTTAAALAARLRQQGRMAQALLEGDTDHPLHVGGALHPSGLTPGEPFFTRYTVEDCIRESLDRWRAFVTQATAGEHVSIVESYPFQSSVRLLLQLDADLDRIRSYARAVDDLLAPLAPVLIYFQQPDVAAATARISQVRGAAWTAYGVALITQCPYAWRRHLVGVDGAVALLRAYQVVMEALLADSLMPRLVLADCTGRWATCYQAMATFLAEQDIGHRGSEGGDPGA